MLPRKGELFREQNVPVRRNETQTDEADGCVDEKDGTAKVYVKEGGDLNFAIFFPLSLLLMYSAVLTVLFSFVYSFMLSSKTHPTDPLKYTLRSLRVAELKSSISSP